MIPIALALAEMAGQLAPTIAGWLGGSKAADVATKVVDVAKAVTGQPTGDAALAAIQADPNLAMQYQKAMLDNQLQMAQVAGQNAQAQFNYELGVFQAESADRANARQLAAQQPKDWVRPTITLTLLVGFFAMCFYIFGQGSTLLKDATASLGVGTIIGYVANELKQTLAFWFGTTKDATSQSQTITQFAVSPGSVTPADQSGSGQ